MLAGEGVQYDIKRQFTYPCCPYAPNLTLSNPKYRHLERKRAYVVARSTASFLVVDVADIASPRVVGLLSS